MQAKTSAPPQRSEHAGTVGGIRRRQVPWMIAARSWSRRLLGLAGPGLTPPCPWQRAHEHGWQESSVCSSLISDIGPAMFGARQSAGMLSNLWKVFWYNMTAKCNRYWYKWTTLQEVQSLKTQLLSRKATPGDSRTGVHTHVLK